MEFLHDLMSRPEGEPQIAIAFPVRFSNDLGGLGGDETSLLQLADVLAYGVLAHANRSADGLDAGPALVGLAILATPQETVHRQFSGA